MKDKASKAPIVGEVKGLSEQAEPDEDQQKEKMVFFGGSESGPETHQSLFDLSLFKVCRRKPKYLMSFRNFH